jgi:hypothetical protein
VSAREEFHVRDDRDLTPLLEKLKEQGAITVFTVVHGVTTASIRMPPTPGAANTCRQLIADWNTDP